MEDKIAIFISLMNNIALYLMVYLHYIHTIAMIFTKRYSRIIRHTDGITHGMSNISTILIDSQTFYIYQKIISH